MLINLNENEIKFILFALERTSVSLADKLYSSLKTNTQMLTTNTATVRLTKSGRPAKKPGRKPGKKYGRKPIVTVKAEAV